MMSQRLYLLGLAIIGSLIGAFTALLVLALARSLWPPGRTTMDASESMAMAIIGFALGFAASTYAFVLLVHSSENGDRSMDEPVGDLPTAVERLRKFLCFAVTWLCAAVICVFGPVAYHYAAWSRTDDWTLPLDSRRVQWALWKTAAQLTPFAAVVVLTWSIRRRVGLLRLTTIATLLMTAVITLMHLPGQHQTIRGGRPDGNPNGGYEIAAVVGSILEWGVLLIVVGICIAYVLTQRLRRPNYHVRKGIDLRA